MDLELASTTESNSVSRRRESLTSNSVYSIDDSLVSPTMNRPGNVTPRFATLASTQSSPPPYVLISNKFGQPIMYSQANVANAFDWPINIMKCFGILPVCNADENDSKGNLSTQTNSFVLRASWGRRRWLNILNISVVAIVITSMFIAAAACFRSDLYKFDLPTIFNISMFIWSFQQALVAVAIRRVWRGPLKQLLGQWNEETSLCSRGPQAGRLKRVGLWMYGIAMAFGIVNAMFVAAFTWKSLPGSDVLIKYDSIYGNPTVDVVAKVTLNIGQSIYCFYWCFVCSLIALIGYGLALEFDNVAKLIETNYNEESRILNVDLNLMRVWHQNICYLMCKADDSFHFIIATIFCTDMLSIVLLLYEIFSATSGLAARLVLCTWLFGATVQWLIICMVGSLVHERAHRPLGTLYDFVVKASDNEVARFELALFISRLSSGNKIGFSAWRFLTISRDTILSISAYLLTLILVLVDLAVE